MCLFLSFFFPSSLSSPFLPSILPTTSMDPYDRLVWDCWMPKFRSTISSWSPRICNPVIDLLECWMPLLPSWVMDNILDQMILPRLHEEVETWDPTTDTMPIHAWVHPWLPLMGTTIAFCETFMPYSPSLLALLSPSLLLPLSFSLSLPLPLPPPLFSPLPSFSLPPSLPSPPSLSLPFPLCLLSFPEQRLEILYAPIRYKLATALNNWHPSDSSAHKILEPWLKVQEDNCYCCGRSRLHLDPYEWGLGMRLCKSA